MIGNSVEVLNFNWLFLLKLHRFSLRSDSDIYNEIFTFCDNYKAWIYLTVLPFGFIYHVKPSYLGNIALVI